ncbi:hypothetical protein CP520_01530 [Mesoplasma lactucae ATCC 49193]|uniref:PTS EIIA type-4 domain-containing protein n=2 Tax=Mesoplasma lactucae TaxID=138853 RepID=A0A291IRS2_9MOLU|nr:hypothetical protein CP520_01530 [Mesoplasma lactucae ATCC 49193]
MSLKTMVSILVVSHSHDLAKSTVDLIKEMKNSDFILDYIGGDHDRRLGTNAIEIKNKIKEIDQGDGVIIVPDIGSSILNARAAINLLSAENGNDASEYIKVFNGPFLEGLLAMVVVNDENETVNSLMDVGLETVINWKK